MGANAKRFWKLLVINSIVFFVVFYLFEEDHRCILDFGSKCSNRFILRTSVQILIMTVIFYFMGNNPQDEKK
jgi:hypothetical protein